MSDDYLVRATLGQNEAQILVARTTGLVERARIHHDTWPTATAALGRTLSGAVIMAAMLNEGDRLTLQILGDGPLGRLLAVADAKGSVKGYVEEPHVDLPLNAQGKLDVAGAVGREGLLNVLHDLGFGVPYRGTIPLASGEIGLDLAEYYRRSQQTPSAVGLGVLVGPRGVEVAGGFILQLLPGASPELTAQLEENVGRISSVTAFLAAEKTPERLLAQLARSLPVSIRGRLPLRFQCDCSRERFTGPLISLGRDELASILAEQGRIELTCRFCNRIYDFSPAEAQALMDKAGEKGR